MTAPAPEAWLAAFFDDATEGLSPEVSRGEGLSKEMG